MVDTTSDQCGWRAGGRRLGRVTEKRSKSSQGRSDLGGITLNEVSQTEKDKKRVILLICEIYKTKQMNRRNKRETE